MADSGFKLIDHLFIDRN